MCRYSNNLYNVALYNIRQLYFSEQQFLTYESNYHLCKENENYGLLQAGVAQQTLKIADRSFKSFLDLIKKAQKGEYRLKDISIPKYRKKGSLFVLVLSTNAIAIADGFLRIPMSRKLSKNHSPIKIPFPGLLEDKRIKEVRILPVQGGRYFKVQYCYEEAVQPLGLNRDNALAVDIGVDNLATCASNAGTPFIMDGRKLKSINRNYNKRMGKLQSVADMQCFKRTNLMCDITEKRNRQVRDYIKKTARYIVNYCIAHDIGTIVCGYNPGIKSKIDNGKRNNQSFVQIPYRELRLTLRNLCERYDIRYIEQEESYTSKASFLDKDKIPVYNPNDTKEYTFSGKRIHRGMYRASDGRLINADVNGALNILRKSSVVSLEALYGSGVLGTPVRIRVA